MQHNLSMSQIDTQDKSSYDQVSLSIGKRVWKRSLLFAIAMSNFCDVVYIPATSESALIGEACNREVVTYLYQYLVGQLETMAMTAYRLSLSKMHAKSWLDSFYHGAVHTIHNRLKEQRKEMESASNDCRALVVCKDAELRKAVQKFYPSTKREGGATRIRSREGFSEGVEAGNRVALNRGIEA